jgi:signal transduction histidine kinase
VSADATRAVSEKASRPHGPLLILYELAVALPTLVWLAYQIAHTPYRFADPYLVFWALSVALVDLMPVAVSGSIDLSLSFPIVLAVALVYSPPVAALVALVGSVDPRELRGQISGHKALFVRAQVALSVFAQAYVFHSAASLNSRWYVLTPAVLAAIGTGYVVNVFFVAVYLRLAKGTPILTALAKQRVGSPLEFAVSYVGLSLLGLAIGHLYVHDGAWAVAIFIAPLVFGRQMYFRSRALSDRLAEQNATLAEQASLLQKSLNQEQLAVEEMRELSRMKSEFVAVASHELRTPLTTIIGYAKTLRQPQFASDEAMREEFLTAMERQGDRLLRLVEDLLLTSNLENNQAALNLTPVSVEELLRDLVESLGTRQQRVRMHLADGLPDIVTDRHLLGRVIANLLDNALKYSPEDSSCELGARVEGDVAKLWVADHGVGVASAEIEKVFDRFYQADSSTTRAFGGVGLGLSLVKDLVTAMAGTISVESEVGKGSTFTVVVPIRHPAADPAESETLQRPGATLVVADR